ncbi:MAG: hypothetical protein OSJ69_18085, partial [Acetatifactor sp.]|nr:hypothetical protein [Acetatifactor sp.]
SNPDGLQGKSTQYGGKKTGQTACCGCEYRFLLFRLNQHLGRRFENGDALCATGGTNPLLPIQFPDPSLNEKQGCAKGNTLESRSQIPFPQAGVVQIGIRFQLFRKEREREGDIWGDCLRPSQIMQSFFGFPPRRKPILLFLYPYQRD